MRLIFLSRSLCHFVSLFLFLFQSGQLSLLFNSICRNKCDRHLLSIIFFVWISINRLFIGIIQTFDTSSFKARLMDFPVHFLFRTKKEKKLTLHLVKKEILYAIIDSMVTKSHSNYVCTKKKKQNIDHKYNS